MAGFFDPAAYPAGFTQQGGYTPQVSYAGSPYGSQPAGQGAASTTKPRQRFYPTAGGPVTLPGDWSDDDARQWVDAYDQYIARLEQQWQATSGLQRRQIEAQIDDARKGREIQMEIARLQDQGADRRQVQQLKEQARQFDVSHVLEMQKLGLGRAQTATEYLSTPDRYVQASNFLDLSGQVMNGGFRGENPAPQQKTMADYSALEAGGNPGRQVSNAQVASAGTSTDPRIKAMRALVDASPPSDREGLDNNAYAVLNAAKAIYSMNLTPKQQAAIGSDKEGQQILGSAGKRLGQNPDAWWQRQQGTRPGQGASNAA